MAVLIHRKEALSMETLVGEYIKKMRLAAGLNTQLVYEAWDACSGAAHATIKKFYRDGKLYITLNSSVLRSQLFLDRELLVLKMNAYLAQEELFTADDKTVGFIRELILK